MNGGVQGQCSGGAWGGTCVCDDPWIGKHCDTDCCGPHGRQTALSDVREAADCSVGNCFCLPETNHTGARCEFAPAYTLSGCAVPEHCGVFARTNRTCDDAPAYQSDVGVSASPALVSSLAIESTGRGFLKL